MNNKIQQFVAPLYDHYDGTTYYAAGALRRYTITGTTDANGRVTVFPTSDGTATGTALFSSVLHINAIAVYGGNTATAVPLTYVRSLSVDLKTLVIGTVSGTAILLLGATTIVAAAAGNTVYITVEGVKA